MSSILVLRHTSQQLLAICALILPLALAAENEPVPIASTLYEKALQDFSQGDIQAAKIHIKNAILRNPMMISAHLLLGEVYLEEGYGSLAEKEFLIAESLGASRTATLVPMAKAYLLQNKYTELLETLYPTNESADVDGDMMVLRGDAHLEMNQSIDAVRAYELAMELQPYKAAPIVGKATVFVREGNFADAEAEALLAAKSEPNSAAVWNLKGSINHARGRLRDALRDFERAVVLDPSYLTPQLARIGVLVDLGEYQEAAEIAKDISDDHPIDPRIPYLLSVALARQGDSEGAVVALNESYARLDALPEQALQTHAPTVMLAGMVLFGLDQPEQAMSYLDRYIAMNPGHPGARKLLGSILLRKGEIDDAIRVLEPALDLGKDDALLLALLGEAYSRKGRHIRASEFLDDAIEINPADAKARSSRALNNLARGDATAAIEDLRLLLEVQSKDDQTGVSLVLLYMKQRNYKDAIGMAQRLIDLEPGNLTCYNLLAAAQTGLGRLEEARNTYNQILVRDPDFLAARINLGKLDMRENKYKEAEQRFSALANEFPNSEAILIELARSLKARGKTEEAVRWLEQATSVSNEYRDAMLDLVKLLIETGRTDRAKGFASAAELAAPQDSRVLEALGRVHLALSEKAEARINFRRMSTEASFNGTDLLPIARLQYMAGDLKGAIWSLQKAVDDQPEFVQARVLLVRYLLLDGQIDKGRGHAEQLVQEIPDSPLGYLLLGEVALHQGLNEEALTHYRAAHRLEPSSRTILGLVRTYQNVGNEPEAMQFLVHWLESHPDDLISREALAEIFMLRGEWQQARMQYETIIHVDPNMATVLNNLAMIYAMESDPKALDLARQAYALDPKTAEVNDTLGWILVRNGKAIDGIQYLRNALALSPVDPEINYHLGVALHRLGRDSEARGAIEKALAGKRRFSWSEDASMLMKQLNY